MSNASKYRKKAVEYEQLKQFDRAVASYVRAIEENENAGEEVDVALFNKVGDLTLRQGRVTEPVTYYERAVEHYVNNSLYDNAIALCNKILRNAPGRSNVYFTLGRICGRKGLRADATRNFLEYATRMQQDGRVEEGMRALAEVADLMPELTDVRRLVDDYAARVGISLAPKKHNTPARNAAQNAPEPSKLFGMSRDLVFLEIDYDAVKAARGKTPPPQRTINGEASTRRATGSSATIGSATGSQPAMTTAAAIPAPVLPPSSRLEDLMIFDPRSEVNVVDDAAVDTTVVDGASIIRPYAELSAPIEALPDFEPTDVAVGAEADALASEDIVAPLEDVQLETRNDDAIVFLTNDDSVDLVAQDEVVEPVAEDAVAAVAEDVTTTVAEDAFAMSADDVVAIDAEDATTVVSEDVAETAQPDEAIAGMTATGLPSIALDIAAESGASSVEPSVGSADAIVEASVEPSFESISEAVVEPIVAPIIAPIVAPIIEPIVEPVDERSVETTVDIEPQVDTPIERISEQVEGVDADSETVVADETFITLEQSLAQTEIPDNLDGFTPDEEAPVASDIVVESLGIIVPDETPVTEFETEAETGLLPALDFDAMLDLTQPRLRAIESVETAGFTDESLSLADVTPLEQVSSSDTLESHADRHEVADDEAAIEAAQLEDDFAAADELPPLIFPLASADAEDSTAAVQSGNPTDNIADLDILALDLPDLSDQVTQEFGVPDLELAEFDILEMADPVVPDLDAMLELGDESSAQDGAQHPSSEIVFIDVDVVDAGDVDVVSLDVGSLDVVSQDVAEVDPVAAVELADAVDVAGVVEAADEADSLDVVHVVDVEAVLVPLDTDDGTDDIEIADGLDDLFGDADIPTALIAAEATLVASSRCTELRTASDADPNNFVLRRRLAESLFEAGNREEALAELGRALAGAELAGAVNDAADMAEELVRVAGDDIAHHQKRLELSIRLGEQSRLREAYLDLADLLVRRGEDLRAKAVYARVLEIDPWDDRARTALGDSAPPPPSKPPEPGSDDGHVSLADWLRDDDEPVSTRLRMREPDISGDEQDDFNALLKHFKEGVARSLGEDDYESHYDLGVAYKEMGLLEDAIGEFQMALRSRNNRLAAYEALGQCFLEQGSHKVAVTVLSRALHEPGVRDEQRIGVLYLLGISCEVLQRFDESRGYFQRVYATDIHFRDVAQRLADLERSVR